MTNYPAKNVDGYILQFPEDLHGRLKKLRAVIKKAAPKAAERISYGIPFYEYGGTGYKGRLIYFAMFKKHISVFIPPSLARKNAQELKKYHAVKATYQFPLDKPFPFTLIGKAVKELVKKKDGESAGKKLKTCSRGHTYQGSGPCYICWPGSLKRKGKK